jgi:predicted Zn-dependent protease
VPRFLTRDAYIALLQQIETLAPGKTTTQLDSRWRSDVRWTNSRITMAGDWRTVSVGVGRGKKGGAASNQLDPVSLKAAVEWAEAMRQRFEGGPPAPKTVVPTADPRTFPATAVWSETTYAQTQDTRLQIAVQLIDAAQRAGMQSAGYMGVEAEAVSLVLEDGRVEYVPMTHAQCSISVRAPDGNGAGWAGRSSHDWARIDADTLAAVALEKCLTSRNPVRIEPGRYTVILEPQATFGFTKVLFRGLGLPAYLDLDWTLDRPEAPFHDPKTTTIPVSAYGPPVVLHSTKIGERIFDERINLSFDPLDPDLGVRPFNRGWKGDDVYPIQSAKWVTNGVLTALGYDAGRSGIPHYAGPLNSNGVPYVHAFRLDGFGTPASLEEMIATTERGLLVTRFWNTRLTDRLHMVVMGMTRDGLWLVERGKIKHPVRNMSFIDSPLRRFNQVDQIGTAVPIFNPDYPAVVPPLKVRDFNFAMLEDAL